MSDLFTWAQSIEAPASPKVTDAPKAMTVTELTKALKNLVEEEFKYILLEGEISNFKAHTSGHLYFSLKDEAAQIAACMFRNANQNLKFTPRDGMKVLIRGGVSIYAQRGNYQIIIHSMEPLGEGALRVAYEQLKAKLHAEGLFDPKYKIPIPRIPRTIALITSPTGAAVQDMLNVLRRRFPIVRISLIPVKVQGDGAAQEIARAIERADAMKEFDVIIAGRGGGSLEDLWAFNEEIVARAIFACHTPFISAVGHEVDFTIADFVADVRAPTPSAAAEIAVPNRADLIKTLLHHRTEIAHLARQTLTQLKRRILQLKESLIDPRKRIQDGMLRLADLENQLQSMMRVVLQNQRERLERTRQLGDFLRALLNAKKERLARQSSNLNDLSPLAVLQRGYSITLKNDGTVVSAPKHVALDEPLTVKLHEGTLHVRVTSV